MKRIDYQNPNDDLEAVQEKRNAEIRAYGQAVLAEADSHLPTTIDDWDILEVEQEIEPELPTDEQPVPDLTPGETEEKPEDAPKPETAAQKKKREAAEAEAAEASSKE
jgi:hypothetical protein